MLRKLRLLSREGSVIVSYLLWHRTLVNMISSEGRSHLVTFMTSQCLFVCLFGVYCPVRDFFHSYGDVTITGEGLQISIYVRHSCLLSSEGFFAVPHLLWHRASVYNGHLWGHVTHTFSSAERLAVEPVELMIYSYPVIQSHPKTTQLWDSTYLFLMQISVNTPLIWSPVHMKEYLLLSMTYRRAVGLVQSAWQCFVWPC